MQKLGSPTGANGYEGAAIMVCVWIVYSYMNLKGFNISLFYIFNRLVSAMKMSRKLPLKKLKWAKMAKNISFQDGAKNVYKKQHVWACTYIHGNILHGIHMKWCKNWDLCVDIIQNFLLRMFVCATLYWAKVTLTTVGI